MRVRVKRGVELAGGVGSPTPDPHLLDVLEAYCRDDGAEVLVLHGLARLEAAEVGAVVENRRCDEAVCLVDVAADDDVLGRTWLGFGLGFGLGLGLGLGSGQG